MCVCVGGGGGEQWTAWSNMSVRGGSTNAYPHHNAPCMLDNPGRGVNVPMQVGGTSDSRV